MPDKFPVYPYPYCLPQGAEHRLYVASDRIINAGDLKYYINDGLLIRLLMERFIEQGWSQRTAELMARKVSAEATSEMIHRHVLLWPDRTPEFVVPHVEKIYCGKWPVSGREVTYEWPTGKITRIVKLLYGFNYDKGNTVFVRHEEAAIPGRFHHKLLSDNLPPQTIL